MEIIKLVIQILVALTGCLAALLSILFFIPLRWPAALWWGLKLAASALSPFFALVGLVCMIAGIITGSIFIGVLGIYDLLIFSIHILLVTSPPAFSGGFEHAFGLHWEKRIDPELRRHFLPRASILSLPNVPEPRFEQNVPFATIPGTARQLYCDVWQPPDKTRFSGLAFIYLHGSAFYILDKDWGTRPFFRYLTAQGHVVMDVAYRLSPETDMMGMVNDVKRAISWMKVNASRLGVHPDRIVLGGGSAGAHLAMQAAFTANDPQFLPENLESTDLSVRAVISLYGTSDLKAIYYHTNQHLTRRQDSERLRKKVPVKLPAWIIKRMGTDYHRLGMDNEFEKTGALAPLLGGTPDEIPDTYALYSPVFHVHAACPPTLLIHGEHDIMAPVNSTRYLHSVLLKEKVPAVLHLLPQTDHGFDLLLPGISPPAHTAYYDVERFLAMMV